MATRHPLAALAGFGAFLLFLVAGAQFYGYLSPALGGVPTLSWEVLGVVLVVVAVFAYWWEDSYR